MTGASRFCPLIEPGRTMKWHNGTARLYRIEVVFQSFWYLSSYSRQAFVIFHLEYRSNDQHGGEICRANQTSKNCGK